MASVFCPASKWEEWVTFLLGLFHYETWTLRNLQYLDAMLAKPSKSFKAIPTLTAHERYVTRTRIVNWESQMSILMQGQGKRIHQFNVSYVDWFETKNPQPNLKLHFPLCFKNRVI